MQNPLFRRAIAEDTLQEALKHICKAGGSSGVDKVTPKAYRLSAKHELPLLHNELTFGTYKPSPLRRVLIPKSTGGKRIIGVPCVRDRVVGRAVTTVLNGLLEPYWCDCSHGYRLGRSVKTAAMDVIEAVEDGVSWIVRLDIRSFFDSINHQLLLNSIQQFIPELPLINLIRTIVAEQRWYNTRDNVFSQGVCQGMPLSPLLANTYLHALDEYITQQHKCVRYADDFIILCNSHECAMQSRDEVKDFLETKLRLECKDGKEGVLAIDNGFEFLGLWFCRDSITLTKRAQLRVLESIDEIVATSADCEDLVKRSIAYISGWANSYCIVEPNDDLHRLAGAVGQRVGSQFRLLANGYPRAYGKSWSRQLRRRLDLEKEHTRARATFLEGQFLF